jgi:uncharacterized protein (TIGR02300 family)
MATKADRGAKRVCLNCRNKFYDLARDPIVCPICQTVYEPQARPAKPIFASAAKVPVPVVAEEVVRSAPEGGEIVSLDELEAQDRGDIGDIDADDIAAIDDDADIDDVGDDETFLEEVDDDEADSDMTDLVGSAHSPDDDI